MISNEQAAAAISALMLDITGRLDRSVADVFASCTEDESIEYRNAVGHVLGEILLEILNPLYHEHPRLRPGRLE
mgnify:CR=1 FL=1